MGKKSPKKADAGLNPLRKRIDKLDETLLKLLSERGGLAKKIGNIKKQRGEGVYVPSREKQIFDRLSKLNDGPYRDSSVVAIFREIISATRALEEPTRVAFLGPEATFTHMAAVSHFGGSATFCAQSGIAEVFSEVEKAHSDYGVVPVENSTEGVVNYTLDKFVESDLKICSEIIIPVAHCLLSAEPELSRVRRVYSHPQALSQCRGWLAVHLPEAELKEADSTSLAAKRVTREKGAAAVASRFAADMHGLNILAADIQDQVKNFTRFLVLGREGAGRTGNDKTSFAFVAKDRAGVLYRLLRPLAEARINLTKIESRPLKKRAWEYMFFVDLDGHVSERRVQKALERLREECESFKILGSYPSASSGRSLRTDTGTCARPSASSGRSLRTDTGTCARPNSARVS